MDTATPEIYALSLHDALPIYWRSSRMRIWLALAAAFLVMHTSPALAEREPSSGAPLPDRKSTRLNSSHGYISYAVFCLKTTQLFTYAATSSSIPTPTELIAIS